MKYELMYDWYEKICISSTDSVPYGSLNSADFHLDFYMSAYK